MLRRKLAVLLAAVLMAVMMLAFAGPAFAAINCTETVQGFQCAGGAGSGGEGGGRGTGGRALLHPDLTSGEIESGSGGGGLDRSSGGSGGRCTVDPGDFECVGGSSF